MTEWNAKTADPAHKWSSQSPNMQYYTYYRAHYIIM